MNEHKEELEFATIIVMHLSLLLAAAAESFGEELYTQLRSEVDNDAGEHAVKLMEDMIHFLKQLDAYQKRRVEAVTDRVMSSIKKARGEV